MVHSWAASFWNPLVVPTDLRGSTSSYVVMGLNPHRSEYQVPIALVLGHVIAHEIGHVLLRSGTRSAAGLTSAS